MLNEFNYRGPAMVPKQSFRSCLVGNNLKHIRKLYRFSQRELSDLTGISQNSISNIENDIFAPTLVNAYKLSAALNVPLQELFPATFL